MKFSEMRSAIPDHPLRLAERIIDPYWDDIWASGGSASWLNTDQATAQVAAGLGRLPARLDMNKEEAWSDLLDPNSYQRQYKLNVFAALDQWRTLTAEQLALFAGAPKVANGRSLIMKQMFASGMTDVGIFNNGLISSRGAEVGTIYRPAGTNAFERRLAPTLTYQEWLSITGGIPFEHRQQFDRHNLLASELALRVAEFCNPATVLGEKLSTIHSLAFESWGERAPNFGYSRAADLTVVREDGLRVAIEVTASAGKSFELKVENWAKLLGQKRLADSGLVLLFVVAAPTRSSSGLLTSVRKRVARIIKQYPGLKHDQTANRVAVVDWRDWFPAPGEAHSGFPTLDSWFYMTDTEGESEWVKRSVFDLFDLIYEPSAGRKPMEVVAGASALRSTPAWLRHEPVDTIDYVLGDAGFTNLIPTEEHGFGAALPTRLRAKLT